MKAEKFTLLQLKEYVLKHRLSQYKIELVMKRRPSNNRHYHYYGAESCTFCKIVNKRLPVVYFDAARGLANCQAIEERLRGQYQSAVIFQRQPNNEWAEVVRYTDSGAPVIKMHPQPRPVTMRVVHNALEGSITFINQQAA